MHLDESARWLGMPCGGGDEVRRRHDDIGLGNRENQGIQASMRITHTKEKEDAGACIQAHKPYAA